MPSAEVMVSRYGKVAWRKGCGEQNPGKPLQSDTIYRIYSMTKPIVSCAVMMLVERGLLFIDQPVWTLLGESWRADNMRVYVSGARRDMKLEECKSNITVYHLLTHTSGLTYGFGGTELFNPVAQLYQEEFVTCPIGFGSVDEVHESIEKNGILGQRYNLRELAEVIARQPLCFQPGTHYHYGMSIGILGRIVEVISGMQLEAWLKANIFEPLNMIDTSFYIAPDKRGRFANCWYAAGFRDDKRIDITAAQEASGEYTVGKAKLEDGGGGLLSTTSDYNKFCRCMLGGGVSPEGVRILSTKTVEYMMQNHLPGHADMKSIVAFPAYSETTSPGVGFGFGFAVVTDIAAMKASTTNGEVFWGGLACTQFYIDPSEGLVVIFMTQCIGVNRARLPVPTFLRNVVSGSIVRYSLLTGEKAVSRIPKARL